ncbi:hypothetical protein DWV57_10170 [Faecalibacterium sp. AF10-46]|nr:hypothetical protein DWV57_10170 [Faecalibacterium sp. AF10-46]
MQINQLFEVGILALSASLCLAALPKGEPLAKPKCFSVMPKPLTLGEVASRSDDGEGEAVFLIKTKNGARRWSSCMSRFCFSFALGAVPITPNAAHRAVGAN